MFDAQRLRNGLHVALEVTGNMLGNFDRVACEAENDEDWVWLTGSRVAQSGQAPLHTAVDNEHEAAIKTLVAAKADLYAINKVRAGGGGVFS